MSSLIDPHDKNQRPLDRLVAAGAAVLMEDPLGVISRGLDRRRLANRAAISRTTAHQVVESHDDLIREVGKLLLSLQGAAPHVEQIEHDTMLVKELTRDSVGPPEGIRHVAENHFTQLANDPWLPAMIVMTAIAKLDPALRAASLETYDAADRTYSATFQALFDEWNVQPQPGVTVEQISRSMTALTEGFALRAQSDSSVSAVEYAHAAHALLTASLVGSISPQRGKVTGTRREVSTAQILATASSVADQLGLATTLDAIESELGVDDGFVSEAFNSVDAIVTAFWREFADTTFRLQLHPKGQSPEPLQRIISALMKLASHAIDHRGMSQLYIAGWISGNSAPVTRQTHDPFAKQLTPTLNGLMDRESGRLTSSRRTSLAIVQSLFLKVLTEPEPTPRSRPDLIDSAVSIAMRLIAPDDTNHIATPVAP